MPEEHKAGYQVFIYDPNPGIEPLFLPYFYRLNGDMDDTVFIGETKLKVRSHSPTMKFLLLQNQACMMGC